MKNIKKSVCIVCVFVALLGIAGLARAITYQDIIDEIANNNTSSVYDIGLNAPFSKDKSGINEEINPENGNLSMRAELFRLKQYGTDAELDFSIIYSASGASRYMQDVESESPYRNKTSEKELFEKSQEAIGVGWRFELPFVEIEDGRNRTAKYIHLADGATYRYDFSAESGLEDYKLNDIKFESYSSTISNISVSYRLTFKNDDTYYFNQAGYPVIKTDRYKNQTLYVWSADSVPLLKSISDNCANSISIEYGNNVVTVSSADRRYEIYQQDNNGAKIVTGIKNPIMSVTNFEYEEKTLNFTFISSNSPVQNTYFLLNKVTFQNGLETRYEYITSQKWLVPDRGGYMEYPKISRRYEREDGLCVNDKKYSYYLEPSGYPEYKPDQIPKTYVYVSTETNADGSDTSYFYDNDHDQIKTVKTVSGKNRYEELREFDKQARMPYKFTKTYYNADGKFRRVYTETVYDEFGNLTRQNTYTSGADKDKNIHEYKYDKNGNFCIYESYMQDDNTKVEIERSIAPGGFGISKETVKKSGSIIKTDEYSYLSNGNLEKSKVQTDENAFLTTSYAYSGRYGGKYPTEVTVSGIKTADGASETYTASYEYDSFGNVTKEITPEGCEKYTFYDNIGRITKEVLEDGSIRQYVYNDLQNSIEKIDANNTKLLYSYDKYGKIKSVENTDTKDVLLKCTYDTEKRLLSKQTESGAVTKYTYDCFDRYLSVTEADIDGTLLGKKTLSYDDAFTDADRTVLQKVTVTDGAYGQERITLYLFDRDGNAVEKRLVSENGDRIYRYSYDNTGNNILSVTPMGAETHTEYDVFGNPVRVVMPNGIEKEYEYDFLGNCLIEKTNGTEQVTRTFDGLGRKLTEKTLDSITKLFYDANNNITLMYDPEGNKTEYEYTERGFLATVKQYAGANDGIISEYEYDGEGNVLKSSYGGINTTDRHTNEYTLDCYGRPVKTVDSIGKATLYEYNLSGNVTKQTDANGSITEFEYNGLGLVTKQENSKSGIIETEYDIFANPVKITDFSDTKYLSYDEFGELVAETKNFVTNTYSYDADGNVISHAVADKDIEQTTGYEYDLIGNLTAVHTPMGTETIEYDSLGRISQKDNATTGLSKTYLYFPNNTVKEIHTLKDGQLLYYESFDYDKNGNKVYVDKNGEVTRYKYDGMNRLTRAWNDNTYTEYEFDNFNNISKEYELYGNSIETKSYYYDNANHLLLQEGKETTQYEYDNAGNLVKKITGIGSNAETAYYSYDGYNRLSGYIDEDTVSEYAYNLDGLRESKTVNNVKTRYVYDGANIIGEITEENAYTYTRGTELIGYTSNSGDRLYYVQDGHGNVISLLNEDGTERKTYTYNPYGKEEDDIIYPMGSKTAIMLWRLQTETPHNPFRYCGEYYDDETDLIYLRSRYYDNTTGRFITEDPIKDGLNWYSYCNNDPINNIDPLGLFDYDDRISVSRNYSTDVKVLQNELAWLGYYSGDLDGYFGQKTLEAVNAYKNATGLGNTGKDKGVVGKQTWESLGLIYRTQDDINAGVKIATIGLRQYKDFSVPINNALKEVSKIATSINEYSEVAFMGQKFTGILAKSAWFVTQVYHKQPWDIKRKEPWNMTIGKNTFPGIGIKVMYNSTLMTPEELGNYTYGYIGHALGYYITDLYAGSWVAAGLPVSGAKVKGELDDWPYISSGYNNYK